ncbi:hypothetical protein ACFOMD_02675 [Sphingoaurantiacus capsulatus]|uniref:Cell wall polymerase n=1 Tax=Sphingoaurantiacus capsulatus TaxID=1771310 RepID=A0ABV7X851_9SPHN
MSFANLIVAVAAMLLPTHLRDWGTAMRAEVGEIEGGGTRYALSCLGFAARAAIDFHLLRPLRLPLDAREDPTPNEEPTGMRLTRDLFQRPWRMTAACAIAATGLGLAYLSAAGAPVRYLAINLGALLIGFVAVAIVLAGQRGGRINAGAVGVTLGAALLLTSLLGQPVDGATRWIAVGPLFIQPSLILLPIMTIAFARARDVLSTAGILAAAAALALQPDRAMAGALAAGLVALTLIRPERNVLVALAGAGIGFAVTLLRADTLPAVPYVDQILYTSFAVSPLAGLAVFAGVALMLVPAIVGRLYDVDHQEAYAVFGAVWLAVIAAAALGNYPTPVVGYGGSAIIGYVVSLLGLPKPASASAKERAAMPTPDTPERPDTRCAGISYSV